MKRRKFATATVFAAVLLVAAAAAASVSAATSSQKATSMHAKLKQRTGQSAAKFVGTGHFASTQAHSPGFINAHAPANANAIKQHDRVIPGKLGPSGHAGAQNGVGPSTPAPPKAKSLNITTGKYVAADKYGLNAYDQDTYGAGYIDTPPDQALGVGNGFVMEAVNNVWRITDTNFGHMTNAEPMEQLWAPAILATGYCSVSDPRVSYDNVTRKWYATEVAYGPPGCAPGSAVFIGVSTTSDPLSIWNIYVLNTSFDGTTCGPDGCLADQPLLGINKNAIYISTNSFDWDSPAFNGSQLYVIDSTALAAGFIFPNIAYIDIGASFLTPEGIDGCGAVGYPLAAYCWYSVQPAQSPGLTQTVDRNGTEFMMSALDWLGSNDNRVALWALTNTGAISSFATPIFISGVIVSTENYGFPFTDTPFYSPYAEQPNGGNTPFCDFSVGPFCEPGPIANNDDRMNQVVSVKPATSGAHIWGGVNTDAIVGDPIGHLHRRSGIAYFDLSATSWYDDGNSDCYFAHVSPCFIGSGKVNGQGYIANWNNDVIFPSAAVSTPNGTSAAIVYTLTGNDHYPSVAVSTASDSSPVSSIPVMIAGQDVLDDFAWYLFGSPRWGDYSAAVTDSHMAYLATEYIQSQSCSDADFFFDPTCGGTRSEFTNWGTGLVKVNV